MSPYKAPVILVRF